MKSSTNSSSSSSSGGMKSSSSSSSKSTRDSIGRRERGLSSSELAQLMWAVGYLGAGVLMQVRGCRACCEFLLMQVCMCRVCCVLSWCLSDVAVCSVCEGVCVCKLL